jgi:hypothetical protein
MISSASCHVTCTALIRASIIQIVRNLPLKHSTLKSQKSVVVVSQLHGNCPAKTALRVALFPFIVGAVSYRHCNNCLLP